MWHSKTHTCYGEKPIEEHQEVSGPSVHEQLTPFWWKVTAQVSMYNIRECRWRWFDAVTYSNAWQDIS